MKALACLLAAVLAAMARPAAAEAPRLVHRGHAVQLLVDGQPFLIRGGELGNSSATSRAYLARFWPKLKAMGLNTVIAPVTWDAIEPQEGRFDFSSVDWLIADARSNGMHLVLLWFATWKNSTSSYTPGWVKRDTARFPRTTGRDGRPQEIISAFSANARNADARAFAALMRHLKQVDGAQHTVLMMQLENEVGFLPRAREHNAAADAAFAEPVPAALAPGGKSWTATFGDSADEHFMAWHYARYVNAVAAAGKAQYDLPMYVNAAQARPGVAAGDYPSGGPRVPMAREWEKGAPALDFIAPDIYFADFIAIADRYAAVTAPLFIPETERPDNVRIGADVLHAIGSDDAIGTSPFAIEDATPEQAQRIGSLYAMLRQLAPEILAAQAAGRIVGIGAPVSYDGKVDDASQSFTLGPVRFHATPVDPWTPAGRQDPSTHGALVIWLGGTDYLVAGQGVTITADAADGKGRIGLESVVEVHRAASGWVDGRHLNGDQTHQGRHVRLPPGPYGIQKVRYYRY